MTAQETIYTQLFKATEKHVKYYRSDMEIDRKQIEERPNTPFLHLTRETGTTIVFFEAPNKYPKKGETVKYIFGTADRVHILKDHIGTVKHWYKTMPIVKTHFFDGKKLKKITEWEAIRLADQHINTTLSKWDEEEREEQRKRQQQRNDFDRLNNRSQKNRARQNAQRLEEIFGR